MASSINYTAQDDIYPSRFCMDSLVTPYGALQADGSHPIIGISQMGTHDGPGLAGSSGKAAASGDFLNIFADEDHDEPLLYLGAAVTGGQLLCSDSNGLGIPASYSSPSVQYIGAEARDNGASGDLIRVRPRIQVLGKTA